MKTLNELITAAIELSGTEGQISLNNRLWELVGGRGCPLGFSGCSQAVYVDVKTGEYDYGEPGGPGYHDCVNFCKHKGEVNE